MAGLELTISTVFLDAGGVLVEPSWERISAALAAQGVYLSVEALRHAEPFVRRAQDVPAGGVTDDDRMRAFLGAVAVAAGAANGLALARAAAELKREHAAVNLWGQVVPDARSSLERLRAMGLRLAVVSNANGTVRKHLERLDLAQYFHLVVDSAEEGVEKPDPRIFARALARTVSAPGETVHVGDLYHVDVVGARAAGLTPILMDPRDLYPDADCLRVPSLTALADRLSARGPGRPD
jgi:HAD superfamily hydrolase (TIGR01509 family)